ncbi:hypothetical protein [Nocardia altamirensis]|uniref:hypothetical protein n=1 Tax=Nocardia altamirensis TaxID=472158 RepID=UPI00083FF963|nr:hypothetical protein [Nocardia altamirensis]
MLRYRRRVWAPAAQAVADRLGTRRLALAILRITCADWLLSAGVPVAEVAAQLGYVSVVPFLDRHHDRVTELAITPRR